MGYKCSVPNCKSNYEGNGPRVTVFSFPKEISLRNTWRRIIFGDENHKITSHTRVCEKHFSEDDIRDEAQGFDEKTCRLIATKLKKKRLYDGVIPTILPNCPKSNTSEKLIRKKPSQMKPTDLEQCYVVMDVTDDINVTMKKPSQTKPTDLEQCHVVMDVTDDINVTKKKLSQTKSTNVEQSDVVMDVNGDNNDVQKQNYDENQEPKLPSKPNIVPEFTKEECQRLLQCVEAEKRLIFYKGGFTQACQLKKNAWTRVTEAFNKVNGRKRTMKTLKMQFIEMNGLTESSIDNETNTDNEAKSLRVKQENDYEEEYYLQCLESEIAALEDESCSRNESPLTIVDSVAGAGQECSVTGSKQDDTNNVNDVQMPVTQGDVMRLKTEILQCELETAKLTQSQKKEAAISDLFERRMRAKLLSLQLREARLNAWTAEQRATQAGATEDVLQYLKDERAAQNEGNGNFS